MLCKNVLLTVQRFEHTILSPEFFGVVPCLNLLAAPSLFTEYFISIFLLSTIEYLISLFSSKDALRVLLIIFIALMVSPTADRRA